MTYISYASNLIVLYPAVASEDETSSHETKFTYLCLRHFSRILIYSRHLTILGTCYCKRQINVSFLSLSSYYSGSVYGEPES